jgi:hypothetical protein
LVDDVDLSPEVLSVWSILPYRPMSVVLGRTDASMWRWGYDIVVFVPLGLLAGLLAGATPLAAGARVFWGIGAVLVPPLAMQLLVAAIDGPPVGWQAAASGGAVAAGAAGLALACCLHTVRPGTGAGRPMATDAA